MSERNLKRTLIGLLGPAFALVCGLFVPALAILLLVSTFNFAGGRYQTDVTFQAYHEFFRDPFYYHIIGQSFLVGITCTAICLLLGYPTAYALTKIRRPYLLLISYVLVFSPLLTSIVVRAYGWLVLLSDSGITNWVLLRLHIVDSPVRLIFNFTGVVLGLVHFLLPFTVFPILSVLVRLDPALREAAADLGANRVQTFLHVTAKLSFPGVFAATQLTFLLAINAFVTPQLLGGGRVVVLPQQIYQNITVLNVPMASVQSLFLIALTCAIAAASNFLFSRTRLSNLG
jgi:putative spermidine/putrescine transport system permease protein